MRVAICVVTTLTLVACGGHTVQLGGTAGGTTGSDGSTDDGSRGKSGGTGHGGVDGGATASVEGGGPVDAGLYRGPGSYFVDGGAYPDAAKRTGGGNADAGHLDASPGCASLAACCASLSASSQSLCAAVVEQGNATNCATELSELEAGGDCTGVSVLASQVQVTPNRMVSDGTTLFWTTAATPSLLAMPVGGGAVTVLLTAPLDDFLAVDDVNVYVLLDNVRGGTGCGCRLVRIPRNGDVATLVTESGAQLTAVTTLGGTAYWVEGATYDNVSGSLIRKSGVKSAPLLGGIITVVTEFEAPPAVDGIGVTDRTAFMGDESNTARLLDFPLSTGVPVGGPATLTPPVNGPLSPVTSDANAIYWANIAISSDGSMTPLGPAVHSSYIVFDDTYVYWADMTTVGTIMRAPKAGGGTATVLARDNSPTAIAVDSVSVYWADQGGYIKSIPK